MARSAFTDLPPARRDALLDVAGREFAEHGYRGASLNRILAEAGVSKGVAYYYFDDKADLLFTVLERAWADVSPRLPAPGAPFWPGLEAAWVANLAALRARPWLASLARQPLPPGGEARLAPIRAGLEALWARALAEHHVRGDLPAALVLALLVGLDQTLDTWWVDHPEAGPAEAKAAFAVLKQTVRGAR